MNIVEMYDLVKKIYNENEDDYYYIGLRFEDKEREIGEECECSRHNLDREDERDFPVYGSDGYEDLPMLDGTSAWNMAWGGLYEPDPWRDLSKDCTAYFLTEHCYVIAGNRITNQDDGLDDGEIVIKDATVIAKIF